MDWAKTTVRRDEKHLSLGLGATYIWSLVVRRLVNTLMPRQNGRHSPDDIFQSIFMNKNVRISIKFSLTFSPIGPINNIPALVQIMAWRRPGDKPLSEPMMVGLLTHICVTRPQWLKPPPKLWHEWIITPHKKRMDVINHSCLNLIKPKWVFWSSLVLNDFTHKVIQATGVHFGRPTWVKHTQNGWDVDCYC